MLPGHAQLDPVSDRSEDNTQANRRSVEAGVSMMNNLLIEGRFKVFRTQAMFLEEYRLYHRLKGVIVKKNDDLISAVRYALMCVEDAALGPASKRKLDPFRRVNWRTM
jgi:hypothetical protein